MSEKSIATPRRWLRRIVLLAAIGGAVYFGVFFDSHLVRRFSNGSFVKCVAISKSGRLVAAGGLDQKVRVWSSGTGELLHTWLHDGVVTGVAFSPDETQLFSGSRDSFVRVFSLPVDDELNRFQATYSTYVYGSVGSGSSGDANANVESISISKDARYVAALGEFLFPHSGERAVWIWDPKSGKREGGIQHGVINAFDLADDGSFAVIGTPTGDICVCDIETGKVNREFENYSSGGIGCIVISPNSKMVATTVGALGNEFSIRLWDANSGKEIRRLEGHSDFVLSLAFTEDGTRLLSGGEDNTIRLWNMETGQELQCLRNLADASQVALSSDGRFCVSAALKSVKLWEISEK